MADGPIEPPVAKSSCSSGKLGHASPQELRWWLARRGWSKATKVYRCPLCGQFHTTSMTPTEHKRVTKRTRRRLGVTESSEATT
jgi:hypothetical protein